MEGAEAQVFPSEVLRAFSTRVFLHFGVSEQDAAEAADVLVCADLRGIDSTASPVCIPISNFTTKDELIPDRQSRSQLPNCRPSARKQFRRKAPQLCFAVFDLFGIRRIINPATRTANITNLSPKENDPPVRVYIYPNT